MTFSRTTPAASVDASERMAHPPTRLNKDQLGRLGEQLATTFLTELGYEILDRNWRCSLGELDIVARDGEAVVFVEVKTRSTDRYGLPVEAVGPVKLARIRGLAGEWLHVHDYAFGAVRIDVISVLGVGPNALIDHRKAVG